MNSIAHTNLTRVLETHGSKVRGSSAQCPGPLHSNHDKKMSLSINRKNQGNPGQVLHCHRGCDTGEILTILGITWADLFDEPETYRTDPTRERIRRYRDKSKRYQFTGRNKLRDESAFDVITQLCLNLGLTTVGISTRFLASRIGGWEKRAGRALDSLQDYGLITIKPQGGPFDGREITLNMRAFDESLQNDSPTYFRDTTSIEGNLANLHVTCVSHLANNEVSRGTDLYELLMERGVIILAALSGTPQTAQAVSDATGVPLSTVSRVLRFKLAGLGLAAKDGRKWVRGPRDLAAEPYDAVAESMHDESPVARKSRVWEQQRADYRTYVENLARKTPEAAQCAVCGCHFPAPGEVCSDGCAEILRKCSVAEQAESADVDYDDGEVSWCPYCDAIPSGEVGRVRVEQGMDCGCMAAYSDAR